MPKLFKLLILILFVLYSSKNFANTNNKFENYNTSIQIFRDNLPIAKYNVYIAKTSEEQTYGLMNLKFLPKDLGMLFVFNDERIINMWMKNTYVPLDMIFINKKNKIIHIKENTTPLSLENINSKYLSNKVLEINAGQVKEKNIKIGDIIK